MGWPHGGLAINSLQEMRMSWLKSTKFWGAVVLVLAMAGGTAYLVKRRSAKPKVQWETSAVDRGRITARVTATGTLSALVTVQVGSQVSGSILKLYADFNSTVKKGQVIAKIDPRLFQAALENARANYAQAKATLDKDKVVAKFADRQFKRQGPLAKDSLIAVSDLDTAESTAGSSMAQVEADRANVKQALAILHQAEVNLALTSIVSPTDGTVISRNVDVGQTVAASLQAPILFVIAEDLRKMQVDTSVAEADVGKLRAGMQATFTVDAFPGEPFKGAVRQIRNAATTVQNVVTYDAVIDVDNSDLRLRPGMTANITFVFANKDDVLRVTNAALRFRPSADLMSALKLEMPHGHRSGSDGAASGPSQRPGGPARAGGSPKGDEAPDRRTVWVLRDDLPSPIRIKTGTTDGTKTEVVEGALQVGDLVISDATLPAGFKPAATGLLPGAGPPPGGPRRF
jgi:HlyD family secretion protein